MMAFVFVFLIACMDGTNIVRTDEYAKSLRNLNDYLHMAFQSKCKKKKDGGRNNVYLRGNYWPSIEYEMNACLTHLQMDKDFVQPRLHINLFNQFLNFIIEFGVKEDENGAALKLIDDYYIWAREVGIKPDSATFNTLLRANRICLRDGCVRGKLAAVHMNEMIECGILADSFTCVEILPMCSKDPKGRTINGTKTNLEVADAEFHYYLSNLRELEEARFKMFGEKKLPAYSVYSAYLSVYSKCGDTRGMLKAMHLGESIGIIPARRSMKRNQKKFKECIEIALSRVGRADQE